MTVLRRVVLSMGVLFLACTDEKSAVTMVSQDDPEMNAAMQQARSEVATFVGRLQKPQPTDRNLSVKIPLRDGDQVEHFWLADVWHENGVFHGTLGNDPELVRGHKFGDAVSVSVSQISDWMLVHQDRLIGGFTVRVIRNRMSAAERAEFDKGLDFRVE